MTERIISHPWSFAESCPAEVRARVDADLCPRLLLPLGERAHWVAPIGRGVPASFPFPEGEEWIQAWFLPAPNRHHDGPMEFTTPWQSEGAEGEITQTGILGRDDTGNDTGLALGKWVRRVIRAFQELAHGESLSSEAEQIASGDFSGGGIARRDWANAKRIWLEAEGAEPRMSLIVKLAQDKRLREASEAIARQPRQILSRIRENTRMDRVREMDSACIIDYAKRPGRTAVEKAGDRQKLLAVQRIPNRNTLENQTATWVFETLKVRSETWLQEHAVARKSGSARAKSVSRLATDSGAWRTSEAISPLSSKGLAHPVQPNYPLQMEARYREIMRVYRQLYHEKKTEDDAWTWRRVLWAHAARQLMACSLIAKSDAPLGSLYFRQEQDRGQWLLYGSSPGPFATEHGVLDWIDAMEVDADEWRAHAPAPWMRFVGQLGPEWLLWNQQNDNALLVWPILSAPAQSRTETDWESLAGEAADAVTRFRDAHAPTTRLNGLILVTHAADSVEISSVPGATPGAATCVLLRIPLGYDQGDERIFHKLTRDLRAGIQLALDL